MKSLYYYETDSTAHPLLLSVNGRCEEPENLWNLFLENMYYFFPYICIIDSAILGLLAKVHKSNDVFLILGIPKWGYCIGWTHPYSSYNDLATCSASRSETTQCTSRQNRHHSKGIGYNDFSVCKESTRREVGNTLKTDCSSWSSFFEDNQYL